MGGIRGPILMPSACFAIKYEYSKKQSTIFRKTQKAFPKEGGLFPSGLHVQRYCFSRKLPKKTQKKWAKSLIFLQKSCFFGRFWCFEYKNIIIFEYNNIFI